MKTSLMAPLMGAVLGALTMLVMIVGFTHHTEMTRTEIQIFWEALWPAVVALVLVGALVGAFIL